jgi:transposase InsO family protein
MKKGRYLEEQIVRVLKQMREKQLAVRRLRRKRLLRPAPESASFSAPNQEWAIDFLADGLATGRGLRILTVVDSYTRECLPIELDTSLSTRRVTRVLEWIVGQRGCVHVIRCDDGSQFTAVTSWVGVRIVVSVCCTLSLGGGGHWRATSIRGHRPSGY